MQNNLSDDLTNHNNNKNTELNEPPNDYFINDDEDDEDNELFPGFTEKTLFCLTKKSPIRSFCLKLIISPWFERASMFVILVNCVTLGLYDPCNDNPCNSNRCRILEYFDHGIFAFFAIEMCIKIIAMGFIGKDTYLAETWNILDCFIVIASIVEYSVASQDLNISAIRTFRVLRPLRAINRVPSIRILVMLLLDTLPMLGNVLMLCFFVFFVFGIVGIQLWKGVLQNRCFLSDDFYLNNSYDHINNQSFLHKFYQPKDQDSFICTTGNGLTKCNDLPPFIQNSIECKNTIEEYELLKSENLTGNNCINWNMYYSRCKQSGINPFQQSISFDNIAYAWLAIFQIISLESWSTIMYYVQDAHSFYDWIYFVVLTLIGTFFLINLCLVVIATQFSATKKRETERMVAELRRFTSRSTIISESIKGSCWEGLINYIGYLIRRANRRVIRWYHNFKAKQINKKLNASVKNETKQKNGEKNNAVLSISAPVLGLSVTTTEAPKVFDSYHSLNENMINSTRNKNNVTVKFEDIAELDDDSDETEELRKNKRKNKICVCLKSFRKSIKKIINSSFFIRFILISILINSFSMSVEHHNQPMWLTLIVEYSNYFFTIIFLLEMIFKIIADGIIGYIKVGFNMFDGSIVIISIYEIIKTFSSVSDDGASGISVLRTFRLLRIFKLVRFMPGLRKQLVIMMKTIDNVTSFFGLLMLFIFIFSILGMNLFGCKFCEKNSNGILECNRKNFDSLFWALITVFQLLTQEDWNEVLYNGMSKTSQWSAIYFVFLLAFGNYVLFNLFVAILVEGFSSEDEAKKSIKSFDISIDEYCDEKLKSEVVKRNGTSKSKVSADNVFKRRKEYSLYVFSEDNKFRKLILNIVNQKWFDYIILSLIAINCITLAMERPSIKPDSWERIFLTQSNYVFTVIFAVEMLSKIIAYGVIIGKEAYLKSAWNILDGFLVLVSVIDIVVSLIATESSKILGILRVFRLLRTFRPLRVINRAPGLRLVVQTLLASLKPIGNIVIISSTFLIIFGILGVQLFKGKLFHCVGENLENVITKDDCLNRTGNKWINEQYNFDHLGSALMTLFVLSSKDGWVNIMYTGIDAVGVDRQPIENYNEWMVIYFIAFLLLVGFFVINMFVGVVVDNFQKCRQNQENEEKERRAKKIAQRLSIKRKEMNEIPFYQNYNKPRMFIYKIASNNYFDLAIASMIALNLLTMAMEFDHMPQLYIKSLEILNYFFTAIFVIEAILKIVALGVCRYFKERWNQLDMLIVILSIAGIILDNLGESSAIPINPTIIRVMRVLRIARVLKLLKMAKGVRSLLDTVMKALPQVTNLGMLFLLVFFMFAILGVELFGKLNCDNYNSECAGLSKYANFHNFGMSFLTLFRIFTGDNWNGIMKDALRDNVLCKDDDDTTSESSICIASVMTPLFFVFFILIAQFVLVNVVVAVLMKYLDGSSEIEDDEIDEEVQKQLLEDEQKLTVIRV